MTDESGKPIDFEKEVENIWIKHEGADFLNIVALCESVAARVEKETIQRFIKSSPYFYVNADSASTPRRRRKERMADGKNNDLIIDEAQDRIVRDVYGWVATDPKTGLESLCACLMDGINFQAVTTSPDMATKIGAVVRKASEQTGKRIRLVRFVRVDE